MCETEIMRMEKINIVFADSDETYIRPLTERFEAEFGAERLDTTVITEEDSFTRYFSEPRIIDILLINKSMYSERLSMHTIRNMFFLCETNDTGTDGIYKYTSTKEIYDFVCEHMKYISNTGINGYKESKIISIYSPIGGSGKTTVSLAFAQALTNLGKRVLFVSGEDIQSFDDDVDSGGFLGTDFKKDVLNRVEIGFADLAKYTGSCGFDYILPTEKTLFSEKYTFTDFVRATIMAKKLYDCIVFDMPSLLNAEICGFLVQSDINIIITEQGKAASKKLDKLLSAIDYKSENKYTFVCNKFNSDVQNYLSDEYMKNRFGIRITFGLYEGEKIYKLMADNSELKEYLKYMA